MKGEESKQAPDIKQWICGGCHQMIETRDGKAPKECICENTVKVAGFREKSIKSN